QQDRPLPGEGGGGGSGLRGLPPSCLNLAHIGYPEDITHSDGTNAATSSSDVTLFSVFMEDLAPPTPSTTVPGGSASIARGRSLFSSVGCAVCHTPSLTTQPSRLTAGLGNATANLSSDIEIHRLCTGLADSGSH